MNASQHDPHESTTTEPQTSPGRRLREARLSAKLSMEHVATGLHLDGKLLEALEQDKYDELPEPAFVRGYLRGYARLLSLPPGPIIEAYDRHGFKPPHLIADIASRPQVHSTDISMRLVTYAVAIVLVSLMVIWWQNQEKAPPVPSAPPAATGEVSSPAPVSPPTPEPVAVQPSPKPAATSPAGDDSTEPPSAPATEVALPQPEAGPAPEVHEPGATVSLPLPGQSSAPAAASPAATPQADRLDLQLKHDAWVEIYDKDGKRLFFNLAKEGKTVSVSGKGPMRLLLGYARGARIEYNGKPFDLAPFTSGDVARVTLGAHHRRAE